MLTSYTMRALAEAARESDQSIARAPDPAPAIAPDPAPATAPTVEELLAQLEAATKRGDGFEAAFYAAIEVAEQEISKRVDAATTELASKLADARAATAELEAKLAAVAETHASELSQVRTANAEALAAKAALEDRLAAALARVAELEAPAAPPPVADVSPVIDSPPADDSAAPRRRR